MKAEGIGQKPLETLPLRGKARCQRTLTGLYHHNESSTWLSKAHNALDAAIVAACGCSIHLADKDVMEGLLALNCNRTTLVSSPSRHRRKTPGFRHWRKC